MDSNFHFLYFSMPCLQGFLKYLLSAFVLSAPVPKHLYLQNLGSTSSIHRKHTGFTCKTLKYSLIFGLQHFSRVGHMWVVYSNISNLCWKRFLIRYSLLLRFPGYVQFLTNKKFQFIVFFIYLQLLLFYWPLNYLLHLFAEKGYLLLLVDPQSVYVTEESSSLYKPLLLSLP